MEEVTLQQVLWAREERVARQRELREKSGCPLVSFSMNIPGPVKNSPLIRRGFDAGVACLEQALADRIVAKQTYDGVTGPELLLSVAMEAETLKDICVGIEESAPVGRLWDMDVLDEAGRKLDRAVERGCLVCGKRGRVCAATRAHSVRALQDSTRQLLRAQVAQEDAKALGELATDSLIKEVQTTPKPGLVDRNNTGSHDDMDLALFEKSAKVLAPFFADAVWLGMETASQAPKKAFARLRQRGVQAEQAMLEATGGINTHKGAIFSMGLLCGAVGRLWTPEKPFAGVEAVLQQCRELCQKELEEELLQVGREQDPKTAGQRLYLQQGLRGIRGEAMEGFPNLLRGISDYEALLKQGLSENYAGAIVLLQLIQRVQDSNLYHRGGEQGVAFAVQAVGELLQKQTPTLAQIAQLDEAFMQRRLSPGGCADLLAGIYFLHSMKHM